VAKSQVTKILAHDLFVGTATHPAKWRQGLSERLYGQETNWQTERPRKRRPACQRKNVPTLQHRKSLAFNKSRIAPQPRRRSVQNLHAKPSHQLAQQNPCPCDEQTRRKETEGDAAEASSRRLQDANRPRFSLTNSTKVMAIPKPETTTMMTTTKVVMVSIMRKMAKTLRLIVCQLCASRPVT